MDEMNLSHTSSVNLKFKLPSGTLTGRADIVQQVESDSTKARYVAVTTCPLLHEVPIIACSEPKETPEAALAALVESMKGHITQGHGFEVSVEA